MNYNLRRCLLRRGLAKKSVQPKQLSPADATYYHGTNNAEAIRKQGFSANKGEGSSYLGDNYAEGVYLSKEKAPYEEGGQLADVSEVLPSKISAKNIKTVDGPKGVLELHKQYGINSLDENASAKLTDALKKDGYEGLDIGKEVVVFDPKKVSLSDSSPTPSKGVEPPQQSVIPPKAPSAETPKPAVSEWRSLYEEAQRLVPGNESWGE